MVPSALPSRRRSPRISRVQAFSEQGVTLAYPARSWSGVREDDGAFVIAIREGEVQASFDGFSCLLWSPVIEGATEWIDRPIKHERLTHCRLALVYGGAEGLLVGGSAATVDQGRVIELRIEKRGAEYWAFWGTIASIPGLEQAPAHPGYHAQREPMLMAA